MPYTARYSVAVLGLALAGCAAQPAAETIPAIPETIPLVEAPIVMEDSLIMENAPELIPCSIENSSSLGAVLAEADIPLDLLTTLTSEQFWLDLGSQLEAAASTGAGSYLGVVQLDGSCQPSVVLHENPTLDLIAQSAATMPAEGTQRLLLRYSSRAESEAWSINADEAALARDYGLLNIVLSTHPDGTAVALYLPDGNVIQAGFWQAGEPAEDLAVELPTLPALEESLPTVLSGLYEGQFIEGAYDVVTLGGQQVRIPGRWYENNDVHWSNAAKRGTCIEVSLKLDENGNPVLVEGLPVAGAPARYAACASQTK